MSRKPVISLKWGTFKSWDIDPDDKESMALMQEYSNLGNCISAAGQRDTPRQKEIICLMIERAGGAYNRWTGKDMTVEEAKKYVNDFDKK